MTSWTVYDLDHPMINTQSPAHAKAQHEALGFKVREVRENSPMGGAERGGKGGSAIVLFPSANPKTANYLELAYADPQTALPFMKELLSDREGIAMAVYSTPDAEALHAGWSNADVSLMPLRNIDFPATEQGDPQTMKLFIPQPNTNVMQCNALQYATLEEYRNEDLMAHPNTACGWDQLTVVADDIDTVQAFYETLGGVQSATNTDGTVILNYDTTSLRIVPSSKVEETFAGYSTASGWPLPAFASVRVKVSDMGALQGQLEANGVAFSVQDGHVFTPTESGCGVIYEFVPA